MKVSFVQEDKVEYSFFKNNFIDLQIFFFNLEEGVDACKGDGGSPLACELADSRYCLSGIVSWGIDCGLEDVPGVYVNVANFRDWIDSKMEQENLIPVHDETF